VVTALAEGKAKFVPDVLVAGGANGGGAVEGLAATAMRFLGNGGSAATIVAPPAERDDAGSGSENAPPKG